MRKGILLTLMGVALLGAAYVARSALLHCESVAATAGARESLAADASAATPGCDASECAPASESAVVAAREDRGPRGSVRGAYDPGMAMCRFSCAAKASFEEREIATQPGVQDGRLARCPVSGVVFRAGAERPRVHLVTGDYVTCCDHCATKLTEHPDRYVRL